MGRVQAASLMFSDRPLLGQMAIATVLVGSAAALSSAGIAVPVDQVDYAKGWADRAPAAASSVDLAVPNSLPAPAFGGLQAQRIDPPAPRTAVHLSAPAAPMSRIAAVQSPGLALTNATPVVMSPGLGELAPLPLEAPVTLIVPPAPVAAPSFATPSLAVATPVPVSEIAPPGAEAQPLPDAVPMRLINPPELRDFDLAKLAALPRSVPAGFAKPAVKSPASGKVEGLGKKDTVVGDAVYHQVSLSVAGSDAKAIEVRIGADMKPSVKVGDLLGLVADRMDPDSAVRFAAASSAGDYVSLATLRAAGFDVSYNAGSDAISITVSQ